VDPRRFLDRGQEIFAPFARPRSLTVLDARPLTWDGQLTAACFQGLVNRREPRVFLEFEDVIDRYWLENYRRLYRVRHREAGSLRELVERYAGEIDGYVLYDEGMPHSSSVAMTWGSVHGAVPAAPSVAPILEAAGLKKREDLRGRWRTRLEAYEWAFKELFPGCSRHVAASFCLDPHWGMRDLHMVRDYVVAHRGFTFDLSTRFRDRRELALFDRIMEGLEFPAVLMGWHSGRSSEAEYLVRAGRFGHFVICSPDAANLTVHGGIRPGRRLRQRHVRPDDVKVENKVYVSFTYTDGDNIGTVSRFMARNWLDSSLGKVPFTWEVLPLALHMAPGIMRQYYDMATPNDCFIAGPSGVSYTYPTPNRRLDDFLEMTRQYMEACDLRSVFVMNWEPRETYRELDDPSMPARYLDALPGAVGITHNYSAAFGRHTSTATLPPAFVGGRPWVNNDVYVERGTDIGAVLRRFVDGAPERPLFVSVRARDGTYLWAVRRAVENLDPAVFKVVRLDELLLTMAKANAEGRYAATSPSREKLFRDAAVEFSPKWWADHRTRLEKLSELLPLPPAEMAERFVRQGYDDAAENLGDLLAYDALDTLFVLVRAALSARGIYAGTRAWTVERFTAEMAGVADVGLAKEGLALWNDWENRRNGLEEARALGRRVVALSAACRSLFPGS
jgi:hypothetical protein